MTVQQESAKEKSGRRNFWNAPARAHKVHGQRYTKFVRSMRLILPLAALGLIALLMAWPRMEDTMMDVAQESMAPKVAGRNELINPRYESHDQKNRPFVVTAARAVQSMRDPQAVILESPAAEIAVRDGRSVTLHAAQGAYRQKAEKLFLNEAVSITYDGYMLDLDKALIDLKAYNAWSDQPVHGQGPAGTLEASGLELNGIKGVLVFTGPIRLVLREKIAGL